MHRGFVLGPPAACYLCNNMDEKVGSIISKYGACHKNCEGCSRLQQDLDQLGKWTNEWQMAFN